MIYCLILLFYVVSKFISMTHLTPKKFIEQVFISELEELSKVNHYISFAIMATGIEFLGKCLDNTAKDWNVRNRTEQNFKSAIDTLDAFVNYRQHKHILYTDLRCGFAHSFVPGPKLSLSSKNETENLTVNEGILNLRCEDFYKDFKAACKEVIEKKFLDGDKMTKNLISIPGAKFNDKVELQSAITSSLQL
jgi:hypothetical protein